MSTLLEVVAPLAGDAALDPDLLALLQSVSTSDTALTEQVRPLGTAAAEPVWRFVRGLFPAPLTAVPPFAAGTAVDGRRVGASGWEIGLTLPAFTVPIPFMPAGTVEQRDGRAVVIAAPGTVAVRVDGGRIAVRTPGGSPPAIDAAGVTMAMEPDVALLPGGFALRAGEIRSVADGVELPSLQLFLPPLPGLATGPLPVPVTLRRPGGAFARTVPIPLPALPGLPAATVTVVIDRPGATSIADLLPTHVEIAVPLAAIGPVLPGIGTVTAAAVGGGARLVIELSPDGDRIALRGSLSAAGSDEGLLRLTGGGTETTALLTAVAALGPFLADEEDGAAGFAALAAAAAAVAAAVDTSDAALVVHGLSLAADWGDAPPGADGIRVLVDYECRLPLSFGTGPLRVGTRRGAPFRVRHRDVLLRLGPSPGISWRGASSSQVSPGHWEVPGLPGDLLRIADVRTRKGSLDIELDLRMALDLGPVAVEGTTIRVRVEDGGVSVTAPDFTVGIDIPGTITGRGRISFRPGGFEAGLDVRLPALGAGGRAAVGVDGDMVMMAIRADLCVPIPLANTGLGIYSVGGVIATNARPALTGPDPIGAVLAWSPWNAGAWVPGDQSWMGLLIRVGTVPDLGFALIGDGTVLLGVPEASVRVALGAEVLSGFAGRMIGVLDVGPEQLIVAVRGDYEVPHLVAATIPAGAIFRFDDLSGWEVRIGGDRTPARGEPVTARILPGLLDMEAWMFLMAFGDASTRVGDTLSGGNGLQLTGLSLAFGAGFDVEWSAGPFSFEAGGVLLAALTHRPSTAEGPWVLAGYAELHGSVDLGPVSIGASASLEAFVDPDAGVFYADAHACASVDLWFFEIEGCVHLEIGDRPQAPAPAPPSPVRLLALTDRVGNVAAEVPPVSGATPPRVWPDVIPILVFDTWVGSEAHIPGLGTVIGRSVPEGDGWIGTAELAYRYDLAAVRVFEIDGAAEVEVGGTWPASWQLPLTHDVFGGGAVPPQARSLALNVLDLHHWLQPAVMLPDSAPGHPVGVLERLCRPVPAPPPLWFPGAGALLPPARPLRFPAVGADAAVDVLLRDEFEYPADAAAAAMAALADLVYRPPGIERLTEPVLAVEHQTDALCWLPLAYVSDMRSDLLLRPTERLHDAVVVVAMPEEFMVEVRDPDGTPWAVEREGSGRWVIETWRAPGPVDEIVLRANSDQQIGLLGVAGIGDRALVRWRAADESRAKTHDALAAKAAAVATTRRLLRPGRLHRMDVITHWQSRGSMYQPASGELTSSFRFATAPGTATRPSAPVAAAGALQPFSLFAGTLFLEMFDQSVLAGADLTRYVAGFLPATGTGAWLTGDPVQVQFLVDHLTELAALYDSRLAVTARRIDATPGTPPADPVPLPPPEPGVPGPMVASPLVISGLTVLDLARAVLAVAQDLHPNGCTVPRPGAAAAVPVVLEPQAAYRVSLTVDRIGAPPGSGALLEEAWFTTSRYADSRHLLGDLGFGSPGRPLAAFPLPPGAGMPGPAASFDEALEALGLGGYGVPAIAGTAALWLRRSPGEWRFAGVLMECPEPLHRPGRLEVAAVLFDGTPCERLLWDGGGTRVLALGGPVAATEVTVRAVDAPHGSPRRAISVSAPVPALAPEMVVV